MRVIVTGAGGQLGTELIQVLVERGHDAVGLDRQSCDISLPGAALAAVEQHRPDAVINCAAWTKVDAAEAEPDRAYSANAIGSRLMASACAAAGVRLCHLSTDFVFDGTAQAPIDEWQCPRPLGVYGASKLAGEEEVRALCPDHSIVRTSWLYGSNGPNFVLTVLRLAQERGRLSIVDDQRGSPTWTGHLAPALTRLLEGGHRGTFHLTSAGETSWHGLAVEALRLAGLDDVPVDALTTAEYPTPARRPAFSVLDNRAWRLLGELPLPDWQEGLARYLERLSRTAMSPAPR
jgi:dTDP-4-dehydrorhamnose reductase